MKEFIKKLIERLEEEILTCQSAYVESIIGMCGKSAEGYMSEIHAYEKTKKIANQLAEEYAKDTYVQTIDVAELVNAENRNDGWIPVSSGRLPEDGAPVEVTVREDNDNGEYDLYVFESWYQEGQWAIKKNRYNPTVIAWKPKDAPYQPKGE